MPEFIIIVIFYISHHILVDHYPKENLHELSSIFCKIFDPDMSPLAFESEEMYRLEKLNKFFLARFIIT